MVDLKIYKLDYLITRYNVLHSIKQEEESRKFKTPDYLKHEKDINELMSKLQIIILEKMIDTESGNL